MSAAAAVAEGQRAARAGGASAAREAPQAPTLGSHANSSSPAGQGRDVEAARHRRNEAWRLRRALWTESTLPRVRTCGRVAHTEGAGPTLRITGDGDGRRAGFAGLVSCGSVWACPCCARKIGARRAEELRAVVAGVERFDDGDPHRPAGLGGSAALITLTLRHHAGHRLAESWDALRHGWSRVTSGKAYQAERETFGVLGWAAAVEVTHGGEHGWHPHAHVLVFFDTPMSQEMVEELAGRWWERFERAIGRKGYTAVAERGGLDVRRVRMGSQALGTYLTKIAHEVTGGQVKDGRYGNRSPFALLHDAVTWAEADAYDAWIEWEQASAGRRQLTWAKGTRDLGGLGEEATDAELAAEDLGDEDLLALPVETWQVVRGVAEDLLTAAERDGLVGAEAWLTVRGLAWQRARGAPRLCAA